MATRSSASRRALPFDPFLENDEAPEPSVAPSPLGEAIPAREDASRELAEGQFQGQSPAGEGGVLEAPRDGVSQARGPAELPADPFPSGEETQMDTEGLAELLGLPEAFASGSEGGSLDLGGEAAPASEPARESPEPETLDSLIAGIDQEIRDAFNEASDAAPPTNIPERRDTEQHVIFSLGGIDFTAPVRNVTGIEYPMGTTPVPSVPPWLSGVANLRGDIISVVDLRTFLGLEAAVPSGAGRLLVARTTDDDLVLALTVDAVKGIRYLALDSVSDPAATINERVARYVRGTYQQDGDLYVVLDLERLLHSGDLRQFDAA